MDKYKHITINPSSGQTVSSVLKEYQDTEWKLDRVIPVTAYEWIVVLERWDSWANVEEEFHPIKVQGAKPDKMSLCVCIEKEKSIAAGWHCPVHGYMSKTMGQGGSSNCGRPGGRPLNLAQAIPGN